MRSSPDAHGAYIACQDGRFRNRVKPLVRFVKAWKYYCGVPVSSFYLELYTASYASLWQTTTYSINIEHILASLWDMQLGAFSDPISISGQINSCETMAKHTDALSKLQTALVRAKNARSVEVRGNIQEAFYWWNQLFGGNFPAYG